MTHPSSSETASVQPLPCPFCGKTPTVRKPRQDETTSAGHEIVWHAGVVCTWCDVQMLDEDRNKDAATAGALAAWNRRSPSPAPIDTTTYRVVQDTRGQWWLWQAVPSNGGFIWTTVGDTPIEVVAARSSSPSSGIATAKNEIGWLIEDVRSRGAMPRWWDGRSWTHDSMKAVRFAREDDAFAIILFTMPDGLHLVSQATEHMWCAPLPSSGDAPDKDRTITTLRSALENWGQHHPWCKSETGKCVCGLAEILDATPLMSEQWCIATGLRLAATSRSGDAPATPEDTKRLDWLESELAEGRGPEFVAAEYCEHYCVAPSGFQIGSVGGATLREAIDASRSHSETPNGGAK